MSDTGKKATYHLTEEEKSDTDRLSTNRMTTRQTDRQTARTAKALPVTAHSALRRIDVQTDRETDRRSAGPNTKTVHTTKALPVTALQGGLRSQSIFSERQTDR